MQGVTLAVEMPQRFGSEFGDVRFLEPRGAMVLVEHRIDFGGIPSEKLAASVITVGCFRLGGAAQEIVTSLLQSADRLAWQRVGEAKGDEVSRPRNFEVR